MGYFSKFVFCFKQIFCLFFNKITVFPQIVSSLDCGNYSQKYGNQKTENYRKIFHRVFENGFSEKGAAFFVSIPFSAICSYVIVLSN